MEVVVESVECVAWFEKLLEVGRIICEDGGMIFGFYYVNIIKPVTPVAYILHATHDANACANPNAF